MTLAVFFLMFLFLLLLPFLAAIKELVRPLDAQSLSINMEYSKDPRYFGNSFKGILKRALPNQDVSEGTKHITLSKQETIEIISKGEIPANTDVDHVLYVTGDLTSHANVTLHKEIYVTGKASLGERNTLRALAAEGEVSLSSQTTVIRWVDAGGGFSADISCDLGWSVSSPNRLKIAPDCRFRRLYGMPVLTWKEEPNNEITETADEYEGIAEAVFLSDRDWTIIPPRTKIDKSLIFKQSLRIKKNCVLDRDVKTYKKLVLEEGVRIKGSVFAENGITTGPNTRIFGNVFSQEAIYLGIGSTIGRAGAIKSVVARGEIVLDRGVVIYGFVVAGKKGSVL